MKFIFLASVIATLNACTLEACERTQSEENSVWNGPAVEPRIPSPGGTAWGPDAPVTTHVQNQVCVTLGECSACVYAARDSIYADSSRPDGARTLAEIARKATEHIEESDADACDRFFDDVERDAALETGHKLNYRYQPRNPGA